MCIYKTFLRVSFFFSIFHRYPPTPTSRIYALLLLLFVRRSFIICLNFPCKGVHNTIIFSVMNTQNWRTPDIPSKSNYAERFMCFTYINGCFHFERL